MTEAGWIVGGLVTLVALLGGAILMDHRQRVSTLEFEVRRQDIEASTVRRSGFERLARVEESFDAIKEAIAEFRLENNRRHDRTDGRLNEIERKIDRSNGGKS